MTFDSSGYKSLLLLAAGAKGAIGSTLAASVSALRHSPESVLPYLTTADKFQQLFPQQAVEMAGWDISGHSMTSSIKYHGVLPEPLWADYRDEINSVRILSPPSHETSPEDQVKHLSRDIETFKSLFPDALPVFINLLPACSAFEGDVFETLEDIYTHKNFSDFPDIAYVLAALFSGIPVVNFTPNHLECPVIVNEAINRGVPIAGCDGKTGQTYFKVVLASAFKARNLIVDGWYSLNILGNSDGKNLMDPLKAAGKLANKTNILDEILGYQVGHKNGSHKVHIDYYPPRGDAKEAWDVIDFNGLFELPMSIRVNLQGRDSILAAPLVLDLARWMAALSCSGRKGLVPELGFYFKKPAGTNPPVSFQDQVYCLQKLEDYLN